MARTKHLRKLRKSRRQKKQRRTMKRKGGIVRTFKDSLGYTGNLGIADNISRKILNPISNLVKNKASELAKTASNTAKSWARYAKQDGTTAVNYYDYILVVRNLVISFCNGDHNKLHNSKGGYNSTKVPVLDSNLEYSMLNPHNYYEDYTNILPKMKIFQKALDELRKMRMISYEEEKPNIFKSIMAYHQSKAYVYNVLVELLSQCNNTDNIEHDINYYISKRDKHMNEAYQENKPANRLIFEEKITTTPGILFNTNEYTSDINENVLYLNIFLPSDVLEKRTFTTKNETKIETKPLMANYFNKIRYPENPENPIELINPLVP